jgi:hypothetical protein
MIAGGPANALIFDLCRCRVWKARRDCANAWRTRQYVTDWLSGRYTPSHEHGLRLQAFLKGNESLAPSRTRKRARASSIAGCSRYLLASYLNRVAVSVAKPIGGISIPLISNLWISALEVKLSSSAFSSIVRATFWVPMKVPWSSNLKNSNTAL